MDDNTKIHAAVLGGLLCIALGAGGMYLVLTAKSSPPAGIVGTSGSADPLAQRANAGDPEAMCALGKAWFLRTDLKDNATKAFQWELKAAQAGAKDCYMKVSAAYAGGFGAPKNEKVAIQWEAKAIQAGIAAGAQELSDDYWRGLDLPKNPSKQVAYLELAENLESDVDARMDYARDVAGTIENIKQNNPSFEVPPPADQNSAEIQALAKDGTVTLASLDAAMSNAPQSGKPNSSPAAPAQAAKPAGMPVAASEQQRSGSVAVPLAAAAGSPSVQADAWTVVAIFDQEPNGSLANVGCLIGQNSHRDDYMDMGMPWDYGLSLKTPGFFERHGWQGDVQILEDTCNKAAAGGEATPNSHRSREWTINSSGSATGSGGSADSSAAKDAISHNQQIASNTIDQLRNGTTSGGIAGIAQGSLHDQTAGNNARMAMTGTDPNGLHYVSAATYCIHAMPAPTLHAVTVFYTLANSCPFKVAGEYCYTNTDSGLFLCGQNGGGFLAPPGHSDVASAGVDHLPSGAKLYFGACDLDTGSIVADFTFTGSDVTFRCLKAMNALLLSTI